MLLYVSIKLPHEEWTKNIDWTRNSLVILDIKNFSNVPKILAEFKGDEKTLSVLNGKFTKVSKFKYLGTLNINYPVEKILSNYIILNGTITLEGFYWTVILSDYTELKKLLKEFLNYKIDTKIIKVVKVKSQDILTARQEQILKIAFEAGFFDFPRKIKVSELADKLNISVSNLSEILRRAEKNIIGNYFRERGL
ncbi:helix-turn-helix domain-containing protein [Acidianus brierleyi]|uniref:helix-turn-helix domain-containing protein n=1 Tax=Acidianus brierleyi TaxID=41673 RepID=UPI001B30550E|nr:helix-turn-helix domain-containing protein [Acidianus brierleyi]